MLRPGFDVIYGDFQLINAKMRPNHLLGGFRGRRTRTSGRTMPPMHLVGVHPGFDVIYGDFKPINAEMRPNHLLRGFRGR